MDKKPQVIVVGGGAAGLTAGIMAARNGAAVTILEQNEKPGRKICVTGNGRCNLTNQEMSWEKFHGQNPAFVRDILSQFSLEDTLKFFDELGIVVTDKKGWLYPRGGQAKYIPELLLLKARSLKVKIKTREKVQKIYREQDLWKVQTEGWTYEGAAVILANGSKASSVQGADGSGYVLARELGHHILKPLDRAQGKRQFLLRMGRCAHRLQSHSVDRWNGNCQRDRGDPADGLWDFRNTGLSDQWNGSQSPGRETQSIRYIELFPRIYREEHSRTSHKKGKRISGTFQDRTPAGAFAG